MRYKQKKDIYKERTDRKRKHKVEIYTKKNIKENNMHKKKTYEQETNIERRHIIE